MTTLLRVGNSEGERRCDAKCYDAAEPGCDCCCGGRNHGAGLKQATANTQELGEQWIAAAARERGVTVAELKGELFGAPLSQPGLFGRYTQ